MSDQEQSQNQSIQISVNSAGDPELERRIFCEVASVGRQLGTISDALALALGALANQVGLPHDPETTETLERFATLRRTIEAAKEARDAACLGRDPDQLMRALEALQRTDPNACAQYRERLSSWLEHPAG